MHESKSVSGLKDGEGQANIVEFTRTIYKKMDKFTAYKDIRLDVDFINV